MAVGFADRRFGDGKLAVAQIVFPPSAAVAPGS
jgi:hypothetical protein